MTALPRVSAALALAALAAPFSTATAAVSPSCQPLALLVAEARSDLALLEEKRYPGAACAFKRGEFKCGWGFPGDQYAAAEAEAKKLTACASQLPDATAQKAKRAEAEFVIEPDLSVVVKGPSMPSSGRWTVLLTIRPAPEAK